jgi:hypothetical protein
MPNGRQFGVEIGEYQGVVRVPRRVFQRPTPAGMPALGNGQLAYRVTKRAGASCSLTSADLAPLNDRSAFSRQELPIRLCGYST